MEFSKKEIIIFLGLIIFCSGLTSGLATLGEFDQNQCVEISQTCASCSYVNISSISYPNSTIAISNVSMTSLGNGGWNYTFCNTTDKGRYDVRGQGDIDGDDESFTTYFRIGKSSSTGESLLYGFFTFVLFGLLGTMFYFITIMPKTNERDDRGTIIRIIKMKYIRVFLIALTYPIIIIILNLLNGLAVEFTTLSIFSGTLGFLFETMLRGVWIWTLLMVLWIFYMLVHDSNVKKQIRKIERYRI